MYNLVTAVVLAKDKPKGLEETDVSSFSLKKLLDGYNGYLVLTNTYLTGELFLPLNVMRSTDLHITDYENTTVSQWLVLNGEVVLPHQLKEPEFEVNKINYTDLHQGGFNRLAVHPYSTIDGYPVSSLTSLYVYKEAIDAKILAENSVIVINGYLHAHTKYKQGVKVMDGCRSMMYSKLNQAGVLSFTDVGGVDLASLNVDMFSKYDQGLGYYHEVVINLGIDLTGQCLLMSLAGQLITSRDIFKVVDPENGIIVLNISRLNFIDRIQNSLKFIEFDELLSFVPEDNIGLLDIETITSDPFILAVLRMSQTFFMILKGDTLTVERTPVMYQGVYGRYYSNEFDYNPMIDEYGRIVPYFSGGNDPYPWLIDKYVYNIPKEFVEKTQNVRNRHKWRYLGKTYNETVTNHTKAIRLDWLKIKMIDNA